MQRGAADVPAGDAMAPRGFLMLRTCRSVRVSIASITMATPVTSLTDNASPCDASSYAR